MATIEVSADTLTVHVTGIDRMLAFKTAISVPLTHVVDITQDAAEAGKVFHGLRLPGTAIPGVVTAGSYLSHGEWSFWDVHDPNRAVILRFDHEHFSRVVVGVDDPAATVALVRSALTR